MIAVVSPADSGVYVCEAVVKDRLGNPQWSDKDQTTVSVQCKSLNLIIPNYIFLSERSWANKSVCKMSAWNSFL